ncbi:MAG: ABC transporter substrate-binding protein [Gammaproteobacteria bacterium]|nr:MAG: ABC transporter substrate-binding protein [Gammaproteobacteria bacterium]
MQAAKPGERRLLWLGFGVVTALLVLLMIQVDRQWQRMAEMTQTLQEQSGDIRRTRGLLRDLEASLRAGNFGIADGDASARAALDAERDGFRRARQAAQQPDFASGDWLVLSFPVGLSSLTPLISTDIYSSAVQNYVLDRLLVRDPVTLEWQGLVARDWSMSEDGLTLRFQLRRDVNFSDGEPLTAHDIVFTYEFIMNEVIAAPRQRVFLQRIQQVTALDDYTVEFVFAEPYFASLELASLMDILPAHFYARFLDNPRAFNESRGLLLGSGPYRLRDPESWTPDQGRVELERNPRYWGPVDPPFDRIVWRVIENDSARLTTFRNGDIDAYEANAREYATLLRDANLLARTQKFEFMSPVAGYTFIAWNQQRSGAPTRFADRRVRQAMSHLTDIERMIDEIFLGYAEAAISPFNTRSPQHDPALTVIPFDLQRARALLLEAGYEDRNGDGVLQGPDGRNFDFELIYPQSASDTQRAVLFLRDLYARAGIIMRPAPTEWSVMIDKIREQDFDAMSLGWSSGVETDITQMFHSSEARPGGDNFMSYVNPALDALMDQARGEIDHDARMQLWQAAERILYEDQPYTFLFRRQSLVLLDRRLQNLEVTGLGLNLQAVPVEIYVPAALQRSR